MSKEKIYIFDTTLRDGAQTQGVDFSLNEKEKIAKSLDHLGVDYIEGGWPGANPTDTEFFNKDQKFKNANLTAFGMTKKSEHSANNDPMLSSLINSKSSSVCLFGKAWDFHVDVALGISNEQNLENISESAKHIVSSGKEFMFDAEHFFDGYKSNSEYALSCLKSAYDNGARWIVLCDTNGGTLPHEISKIVEDVTKHIPGKNLGIHAHNDTENAVANSLVAVQAGVRQVQGTINGLGERCGNADLITLIPNLMLKMGFVTNIPAEKLARLTSLSNAIYERLNRLPDAHAPYVGEAAFAHKGGLHASAAQKDPRTYEHIPPESVGNQRTYLISDQTGKSNILARFAEVGIEIDPKDSRLDGLIGEVKEKEFHGWAFDSAEASFELLARRRLGGIPSFFEIGRFRVMDERRFNARGEMVVESEATASIIVNGDTHHEVAVGNGPVNAVDTAIRKALVKVYPQLADVELVDYKVRILPPSEQTSGTAAVTRVLIEFQDGTGLRWRTVGVSANIIDASVNALADGICWKLIHHGNQ